MNSRAKLWAAGLLLVALFIGAYALRRPRYVDLAQDPKLAFADLEYSKYVSSLGGNIRLDVYSCSGMTLDQCGARLKEAAVAAHFIPQTGNMGSLKSYSDEQGRELVLFEQGFSVNSKMPELVFTQDADTPEEKVRLLSMPITGTITPAFWKAKVHAAMHP